MRKGWAIGGAVAAVLAVLVGCVWLLPSMLDWNRYRGSIAALLTSNLGLGDAPGNILLPAKRAGLPKDSVANVSQLITLDRTFLDEQIGRLPSGLMNSVDEGLKLVLGLS